LLAAPVVQKLYIKKGEIAGRIFYIFRDAKYN